MSPTTSRGRGGRVYRYYVLASLQQGRPARGSEPPVTRIAAPALEALVARTLTALTGHPDPDPGMAERVDLAPDRLIIRVAGKPPRQNPGIPGVAIERDRDGTLSLTVPLTLPLRGGRRTVTRGEAPDASPDPVLIAALRRAHAMLARDAAGMPLLAAAPASIYQRRILRLAFLAPDIQRAILAGHQPPRFNLEAFMRLDCPLAWPGQRRLLGFPG